MHRSVEPGVPIDEPWTRYLREPPDRIHQVDVGRTPSFVHQAGALVRLRRRAGQLHPADRQDQEGEEVARSSHQRVAGSRG